MSTSWKESFSNLKGHTTSAFSAYLAEHTNLDLAVVAQIKTILDAMGPCRFGEFMLCLRHNTMNWYVLFKLIKASSQVHQGLTIRYRESSSQIFARLCFKGDMAELF
jgi:hypothetical protein